jgi:hypothetical protein
MDIASEFGTSGRWNLEGMNECLRLCKYSPVDSLLLIQVDVLQGKKHFTTNMQICKYANTQAYKHTNIQI